MYKTTLKIDGMLCSMCETHINDTVRRNMNAKKVSSSHSKGLTEIISEAKPDKKKLREAIAETGYTLTDIHTEPYEKKGFSLFRRK